MSEESCCLDKACPIYKCPEPICVMDFPGGLNAYLRYKKIRSMLESGLEFDAVAEQLQISCGALRKLYNRAAKVMT